MAILKHTLLSLFLLGAIFFEANASNDLVLKKLKDFDSLSSVLTALEEGSYDMSLYYEVTDSPDFLDWPEEDCKAVERQEAVDLFKEAIFVYLEANPEKTLPVTLSLVHLKRYLGVGELLKCEFSNEHEDIEIEGTLFKTLTGQVIEFKKVSHF